jgi:diguanylate cyclase (GGDEF)-like protein
MRTHKKPLNRGITKVCVTFILFLCITLSVTNLYIYSKYVYDDYRGYITDILNYVMSNIDADDLKHCIETGEESEKYKETLLLMDNLMEHFTDIHYLYSVKPLNTEATGSVMSVLSAERYYDRYVDTEGNLYLGWISDTEYDSETASVLFDIMNGDSIVFFEEKTEWGTDYTGSMPIKDSQGNGIAVLAVDIDISFLHGLMFEYALVNSLLVLFSGLVFIAIFIMWSRHNITHPINQLVKSAVGFADHSHGQRSIDALRFTPPKMDTDNEIKALSDAVVKMSNDIRDYVSDIVTAEKKAATMEALANHDALTGTGNKTAYNDEMARLEKELAEGHVDFGIAVVDLNYLKTINDTYGHDKGDIAIKKLCQLACRIFSQSHVYRIGGDEFAIILRGSDYDNHEALCACFEEEILRMAGDDTLKPWEKVSAAIGIACYDKTLDKNAGCLFKRADHLMYERKRAMKKQQELR